MSTPNSSATGLASTVTVNKSVPPPLTSTVVVTKAPQVTQVPTPTPLTPIPVVDVAGNGSDANETNGHGNEVHQESGKKKRKRSSSTVDKSSQSKKQKTGDGSEKKKKKSKKENIDDSDEEEVEMSKNELGEFVQSIMDITHSDHPETALVMVEQKLSLLDQLKTIFGLEPHTEDVKVLELIIDAQLKAIYKGMVIGKLMLPMEEYQKDGAWGFVSHILDSQAAGKHLVPYALCCWDHEKSNIQSSIDDRKRMAAINPQSKNFYLFNKDNEFKKALRRTKFWYAFANELQKEEDQGRIDGGNFSWDQLKTYCEAFWSENPEAKSFKKYWMNVYADKQSQLVSYPAWPIPKGAYQEGRDFILGVWPFVQIYFMSSINGPILLGERKNNNTYNNNAKKSDFDFGSALKKLEEKKKGSKEEAKKTQKVVVEEEHDQQTKVGMMVIDDSDEEDDESDSDDEQREKKGKHKSKSKKHGKKKTNRLSKFTDSQAEEDDD
jgi:hypothetical protein